MTKRLLLGVLIGLMAGLFNYSLYGQGLNSNYQKVVKIFIDLVRNDDKEKIASLMTFPFDREYPIPSIKNKQDFIRRYDEIFDQKIRQSIIESDLAKDWTDMGWRGIMLKVGQIWLDYHGRIISINYQSKLEKELYDKLILEDKKNLYRSLFEFKKPVYVLETRKYRIRIDDLGEKGFRYASWPIDKTMADKPDLVIKNGQYILEGNGGNHSYKFKNEDYIYECSIIVIGEENSAPAILTITKGTKTILTQTAIIIKK